MIKELGVEVPISFLRINYGKRIADVLEFAASDAASAEIDIGDAKNPKAVAASLYNAVRRLEGLGRLEAGAIKVATRRNRIFLYRT